MGSCFSSILTKLTINVNTFDDCLYHLDGLFIRLSTLIIDIEKISISISDVEKMKQLSKLKYFSLTSMKTTIFYDDQVVPLLRQMSNLEELTLFLIIKRLDSTYINGIQLYDQILIHMPRLNKFTFSINTLISNDVNISLPSNDDIQRSFIGKKYQQVGSYADDKLIKALARCHIYSLPDQFDNFHHLNNSFQGSIFEKVKSVKITDIHPFEHEFFKIISQSFPFLQYLSVQNDEQQKNKQHLSTLIIFPHLRNFNLTLAHIDYAEKFLMKKTTDLPCLAYLRIKYEQLVIITNHFTNNSIEFNFSQLKFLSTVEPFVCSENFHLYFPQLQIFDS
ncbi:unnamed protein product [Rotaria sp. Silwood2]|nr:unnamed protein product [Rotaria sp. Silwood2]CAF4689225.1 unnamed protein product [Rotaria sp. Silwood2]